MKTLIAKPRYRLTAIQAAFDSTEKLNMTYSAMQGQYALVHRITSFGR